MEDIGSDEAAKADQHDKENTKKPSDCSDDPSVEILVCYYFDSSLWVFMRLRAMDIELALAMITKLNEKLPHLQCRDNEGFV